MKMLNKSVAALLIASVFAAGCAHTTANPVLVAQVGDDAKTCDGITNEMQQMVQARAVAEADRNKQIATNVALGVAGAFLLVPWFFMDTSNAATVEERAAQARYQRLNQMQIDKKCSGSTLAAQPNSTGPAQSTPAPPASAVAPALVTAASPTTSTATGPAVAVASTGAPSASVSNAGQDSWNVERLSEVKVCAAEPQAKLIAKGPGFETYAVGCSDGNALAVRCEYGNCRVLR